VSLHQWPFTCFCAGVSSVARGSERSQSKSIHETLRTDAWHTDQALDLSFPPDWNVTVQWPPAVPVLSAREIGERLDDPVGRPPVRDMCRGKSRPLVIVDDLNRPTPADQVLPLLLERFREAGIPASAVTILLSTGTHGAPSLDSVRKKVGPVAASACRVLIHNAKRDCVRIGRTSSGTPVLVDKAVLASDLVIGIGGVYPNYTAGYGGGSKLALGVLGFRTIKTLHFRFHGVGWGQGKNHPLRTELDEIARLIGLTTTISLHINADREVVRVTCGDHSLYYDDEVAFAQRFFSVPVPEDADVVISNAYPSDLSLTAVLQKGTAPLQNAGRSASRVVIASCAEGIGHHGLFPVIKPRYFSAIQMVRRIAAMKPHDFLQAIARRVQRQRTHSRHEKRNPIWLYRPGERTEALPKSIPGYGVLNSWPEVLAKIDEEQGAARCLRVVVYPCAPLQSLRHT
jgi:lactate racemase